MTNFEIPAALQHDADNPGSGWLVSSNCVLYPEILYRVRIEGGELLADIFDPTAHKSKGARVVPAPAVAGVDGDPWTYDIPTGIRLTAEQVQALLQNEED